MSSYALAHAAKQRAAEQEQERRAALQRQAEHHAKQSLLAGVAGRSEDSGSTSSAAETSAAAPAQNYGTANRVRALGAAAQQRETDYIQATEERMGRERQLRLETQRRRKAARRRQIARKRIEDEKREKQLKERQKKKGAYVRYIRKHLTKIIVRPPGGAAPSSSASTRGVSGAGRRRRKPAFVAKKAVKGPKAGSSSSSSSTSSSSNCRRRTWTKKPTKKPQAVPQGQRIKRPESPAPSSSPSLKNCDGSAAVDGAAAAPRQTSNLLRDLRAQMRRNEKLRCSIEALDLQVKLHKQPDNNTSRRQPKGSASAATLTRSRSSQPRRTEASKRNVDNPGDTIPEDSYEAEGIPEVLPEVDHFGFSSSEEEDEDAAVKKDRNMANGNNDSRPARKVQEVLAETAGTSSLASPSSPSCFYGGRTKDAAGDDRGDPPMAPPMSPSSFSLDPVVEDIDDDDASKENKDRVITPTWIRTLDPAPTKIFDSLDLSMTTRQSIEVERNRRRVEEEEEEEEEQPRAQAAFGENASPNASLSPSSPRDVVENVVEVETPGKRDDDSKTNNELVSFKVASSNALTPGSHIDMKYNSMRTHAPTSPRSSDGGSGGRLFEEASQLTVASTTTTTTQASEGGYAFLRQRALDRKKRSEERKRKKRLAHKRKMMMRGLQDNVGSGEGSTSTLLGVDGSKTLDLRKRASWGRDIAKMSPRRRARREAALRRKEYEKMINMQMKEERLQRRRILQRQRRQLREQESRVLMQQQHHQQPPQIYHHQQQQQQQYQQQPRLPAAQWQQEQPCQPHHQVPVPSHGGVVAMGGSNIPHHPTIVRQEAPPSEPRPLGHDYARATKSGFRADIDPRSTISIEEDRLRGSLLRLEHRLEQTRVRKLGGTRRGERRSREARRGKSSRYAGVDSENFSNNSMHPPGLSRGATGGGRQQNFMHTEKGSGGDILRYPVAQQQQQRQVGLHQPSPKDESNDYNKRAAARYASRGHPSTTTTNIMRLPPVPVDQNANAAAAFRVHAPTEIKVLRSVNGGHPAEVQLSYSVMPMHTVKTGTENGGSVWSNNASGYFGLREHRQASHMQRLATMRPVSQQQPRASRMASGAQRVRPASHQQPRAATLRHNHRNTTRRQPKGSLHQKPRTRRVVLGNTKNKASSSKVRTSGLVQVDTDKLHLLLSP